MCCLKFRAEHLGCFKLGGDPQSHRVPDRGRQSTGGGLAAWRSPDSWVSSNVKLLFGFLLVVLLTSLSLSFSFLI